MHGAESHLELSRLRWLWLALALLVLAIPPYAVLMDEQAGTTELRRAELAQIEQECRELDARNEVLRRRIRGLGQDPRYIESVVRSELGWVRAGEQVYQFGAPPVLPPRPERKKR